MHEDWFKLNSEVSSWAVGRTAAGSLMVKWPSYTLCFDFCLTVVSVCTCFSSVWMAPFLLLFFFRSLSSRSPICRQLSVLRNMTCLFVVWLWFCFRFDGCRWAVVIPGTVARTCHTCSLLQDPDQFISQSWNVRKGRPVELGGGL